MNEKNESYPIYIERAFDAYRAYYDYLYKGPMDLEYTMRLNQSGVFQLPPTHVEAMYAPEVFGDLPNHELIVNP